jgi:hypothetical protein
MSLVSAKIRLRKAVRKALKLTQNTTVHIEIDRQSSTKILVYIGSKSKHYHYMGFRIFDFPGCCKYCILSEVEIAGDFKDNKLSYPLLDLAMAYARDIDYSKVVATTAVPGNRAMEYVFKKLEWKKIDSGSNYNTDNIVAMWVKPTGLTQGSDVFKGIEA